MTEDQADVFYEATLSKFMPDELSFFIMGFFWSAMFLWLAWTLQSLVIGVWKGNLKYYDIGRYLLRAALLVLAMGIIVR